MNKNKITLSKIVKLPIEGIQFSNQQFGGEIEYDSKEFDVEKAKEEMDGMLNVLKDPDEKWIRQTPLQFRGEFGKGGKNEGSNNEKGR